VTGEVLRVVKEYARKEGLNPALFTLQEMVRRLRTSPEFLRDHLLVPAEASGAH
jgi:hypothetical protein